MQQQIQHSHHRRQPASTKPGAGLSTEVLELPATACILSGAAGAPRLANLLTQQLLSRHSSETQIHARCLQAADLSTHRDRSMSHLDTLSSVTAPRGAHHLDEQQLLAYLQQQLPALRAFSGTCVRVTALARIALAG